LYAHTHARCHALRPVAYAPLAWHARGRAVRVSVELRAGEVWRSSGVSGRVPLPSLAGVEAPGVQDSPRHHRRWDGASSFGGRVLVAE
jgi:hypothetical protein